MRILVVNPLYPPKITGSSIFCADLVSGLRELGHEVAVLTSAEVLKENSCELFLKSHSIGFGALSYNYSIPFVSSLSNLFRIKRFFQRFRPDIVSVHGQMFDLSLISILVARKFKVPVILTIHSPFEHSNKTLNGILILIESIFLKRIIHKVDLAITVDRQTRRYATKRYPRKEVIEIPVSIPMSRAIGGRASAGREILKLHQGDGPVLLSLGHVVPVRNRVSLVESLPQILHQYPNLKLCVVGAIQDHSFIQKAKELGLDSSVIAVGAVEPTKVRDILAAANVECHDLQGIGLGMATLEAMAAQVPVVAWVSHDNWTSFSLDDFGLARLEHNDPQSIAESILKLLKDKSYADSVVMEQDRLICQELSLASVVKRYEGVMASTQQLPSE